jgi:MFS family permease
MSVSAVDSKSAELVGRLDRLPFSRWHKNLFTLCFLGVMFDACDFALFGMALPPVAREFGLNQAQAGLLATVGLVGAFLGALFWGTISDYIGRRTSFSATIGIFSLFTGLVAASWNVLSLSVFRFLSNFGLGGEVPVALTLTSEYSPSRIRGRMTGSMMAAFPLGLALAALLAYFIIPTYGWRTVFIIGVIPAVLLFFVRLVMPESVRYLLSRGRVAEAERTVAEIEAKASEGKPLPPAVPVPAGVEERGVTVFELLTPERRKRTILRLSRPSSATQRAASSSTASAAGRCCSSIISSALSSICGSRWHPACGFISPSPRSAGSTPASTVQTASMSASFIRRTCARPRSAGSSASAGSALSWPRPSSASCCNTGSAPTCCTPSRSASSSPRSRCGQSASKPRAACWSKSRRPNRLRD